MTAAQLAMLISTVVMTGQVFSLHRCDCGPAGVSEDSSRVDEEGTLTDIVRRATLLPTVALVSRAALRV